MDYGLVQLVLILSGMDYGLILSGMDYGLVLLCYLSNDFVLFSYRSEVSCIGSRLKAENNCI